MQYKDIAEFDTITADEFYENFFLKNTPCVVREGVTHWQAVKVWEDDNYLCQIAGNRQVFQTTSVRSDLGFDHQSPIIQVRFADFLDSYQENPRLYVNDSNMPSILVQDLGTHSMLEGFKKVEPNVKRVGMFMGAGEQLAPLHYDDEENIYILINGQKEFLLFDIADFNSLYPYDDTKAPDFSAVNLDNIDYDQFPALKTITCYRVKLNAGDMLFVPGYWWHAVKALGRSIALSWVRLDRRGQFMAFAKLARNNVFPMDKSRLENILDNPTETIVNTRAELGTDSILEHNLFETYLRLSFLYFHASQHNEDVTPIEREFKRLRQTVFNTLRENKNNYSYPVLFLMQNFFRINLGLFNLNEAN
ncbi:cupin-like domain-containing protein [Endozoicomonas sp. SM1973]|uniref:Cupin-like domain-containing protein n=1 Tax=Spartinivicinus marinus TaxID=2994442 RepID=A0A853IAZ4_9GAMM|nr:cupin-like domain-containing protein [Spartinivicinus marinus]MCX4028547.1 cupin-like domain-containing protein [Spartinivicinus marinus]NYZ67214.1 cupin-like domain-containing protein [Spartinivicinus marinus]